MTESQPSVSSVRRAYRLARSRSRGNSSGLHGVRGIARFAAEYMVVVAIVIGLSWAVLDVLGAHIFEPIGASLSALSISYSAIAITLGVTAMLITFGPHSAGAAQISTFYASPLPRRELLQLQLVWWVMALSAVAVFSGAAMASVGLHLVALVLLCCIVVCATSIMQSNGLAARTESLLYLGATATITLAAFTATNLVTPPNLGVAFFFGLVIATLLLFFVAIRRLTGIDRKKLATAHATAGGVRTGIMWVDPTLIGELIAQRWWARNPVWSSTMLRPRLALLQVEILRLRRRPGWILIWVASTSLVSLVSQADQLATLVMAAAVTGFGAICVTPLGRGLRSMANGPQRGMMLGLSRRRIVTLHSVFPSLGAALWAGLCCVLVPEMTPTAGVVLAAGVAIAVIGVATSPEPPTTGINIDSPFGVIPADVIVRVQRALLPLALTVAGVTYLLGG